MAPELQPQLTGIPTEAADCGVRSVSMVIDWATRGQKVPSVKAIRKRMGLSPIAAKATNPLDWDKAIKSYDTPAELAGKYERLTGTPILAGQWETIVDHLDDGKMVILAVDYGVLRRIARRKTGSPSFSGLHAIPFKGKDTKGRTIDYDPLFDGRYQGCPDGPVKIPLSKVREASEAVGKSLVNRPVVYGYLMDRATKLGDGVVIPEPEDPVTLTSILADLRELLDEVGPDGKLSEIIEDLESLIGPYRGEADPDDDPVAGFQP